MVSREGRAQRVLPLAAPGKDAPELFDRLARPKDKGVDHLYRHDTKSALAGRLKPARVLL